MRVPPAPSRQPAPMHPCLTCGACCAHFRVSFHWSEADPEQGGAVPAALTEPLLVQAEWAGVVEAEKNPLPEL